MGYQSKQVATTLSRWYCFPVKFFIILQLCVHIVHSGPVNDIDFHPSGNYLLSASTDKTLKVIFGFNFFIFLILLYIGIRLA